VSEELGAVVNVVHDGFQISSNEGSADKIKENLESEPASLDGPTEDPKEAERKKVSKAASELGKRGGEAAAKARAKGEEGLESTESGQDEPKVKEEPKKAVTGDEDDDEGKPGNPRHDAKARIQQLARERAEERAKREKLEARLAELEARVAPKVEPKAPTAPAATEKPRPDQFETYEDYVEALTDHKMEQRLKKLTQEAEEQRRIQTHTQDVVRKVETFNERIAQTPDLIERVDPRLLQIQPTFTLTPGTAPGPQNALADEIIWSEMAPQIMLYLTDHEDEVRRILALPNAREIARAIAKLEDKLTPSQVEAEPAAPVLRAVSQAKPPVRPVTPTPAAGGDDVDDDTPFDEYVKVMNARDFRVRRGR